MSIKNDKPELLVIVGPNGSGKSSLVAETGINEGLPIINPDIVALELFSNITDEEKRNQAAWRKCEELRELKLNEQESFGYETVGSHISRVEFIQKAKKLGYIVTLVFVSTENPEINIRRIAHRVNAGGHGVDDEIVRKRYYRTMNFLPKYFISADVVSIWDNSIDTDIPGRPKARLLVKKAPEVAITVLSASLDVNWINQYLLTPINISLPTATE